MTQNTQQDTLNERYKKALDERLEELDGETLSKLRQARSQALQSLPKKSRWLGGGVGWAAGVATAAAMSVTLMLLWPGEQNYSQDFVTELADAELLADEESIEFYEELDFYIWLEQQETESGEV